VPVLVTTLGDPENVIGGNGDGELVLGFVGEGEGPDWVKDEVCMRVRAVKGSVGLGVGSRDTGRGVDCAESAVTGTVTFRVSLNVVT